MRKPSRFVWGLLLGLSLLGLLGATFTKFQPATGILKGSSSTYVTTAAASSDVIGLWSGTCNGTTVLGGAGACVSSGAAVTTGSWSASLTTGCTATQSFTVSYSQVGSGTGSLVTLSASAQPSCTSNSGLWTTASGSIPAAIRPSRTVFFPAINGTDNGAGKGLCLSIAADGTLALLVQASANLYDCGAASFNASGVKGVNFGSNGGSSMFTYRID